MFLCLWYPPRGLTQCQWWQVLNNFTTFYISHQIFFFVFVVLFMLHPVPSFSHVHGLLWWLPIPYSWVRWLPTALAGCISVSDHGQTHCCRSSCIS